MSSFGLASTNNTHDCQDSFHLSRSDGLLESTRAADLNHEIEARAFGSQLQSRLTPIRVISVVDNMMSTKSFQAIGFRGA